MAPMCLSKEGEGFSRRRGELRRNDKDRRWPDVASLEERECWAPLPLSKKREEIIEEKKKSVDDPPPRL